MASQKNNPWKYCRCRRWYLNLSFPSFDGTWLIEKCTEIILTMMTIDDISYIIIDLGLEQNGIWIILRFNLKIQISSNFPSTIYVLDRIWEWWPRMEIPQASSRTCVLVAILEMCWAPGGHAPSRCMGLQLIEIQKNGLLDLSQKIFFLFLFSFFQIRVLWRLITLVLSFILLFCVLILLAVLLVLVLVLVLLLCTILLCLLLRCSLTWPQAQAK